jgi:UDP-N-acetylglucosamine 2-epimerase (hydrolysing)
MRRVLFVSGTRADYGKIKPLIGVLAGSGAFEVHVAVTGMHMLPEYGLTRIEVERNESCEVHSFVNTSDAQDLAKSFSVTVLELSKLVRKIKPNLIVVHGDRMEALAGATAGMFNHILIGHIEGGEVSGTLDETMRHAITKLSNFHFVSNEEASKRVLQMGEKQESIYVVGSPEVDTMLSKDLPSWDVVKEHYKIPFDEFGFVIFHPDSSDKEEVKSHAGFLVENIRTRSENFIVILPNNDNWAAEILESYKGIRELGNFFFLPSMRFEYYLSALKKSKFIIGNSSSGVREAPIFAVPSLDLGSRQENRNNSESILQSNFESRLVDYFFNQFIGQTFNSIMKFGSGDSASKFLSILANSDLLKSPTDKSFVSLKVWGSN